METHLKAIFIIIETILQLSNGIFLNESSLFQLNKNIEFDVSNNSVDKIEYQQENDYTSQDLQSIEYNFKKRVQFFGYSAEEYEVVTKDGYVLSLHRISGSPKSPEAPRKKVVYVQHGLFMSTINLVSLGPKTDFVFSLSDAGFDVWMGNTRGNPYSRSHTSISPDNKTFWDFSFHEVGLIDIKAFIDNTLNITKQEKVAFVGYSLGTTESLILFSLLPEYNKKVSVIVEVAPVAFWEYNDNTLIKALFKTVSYIQKFNFWFEIYELFPRTDLANDLCSEASGIHYAICKLIKLLAPKSNSNWLDKTYIKTYFENWPAGTSAKTLFHLAQNVLDKTFRPYDYGRDTNIKKYGKDEPPEYSISSVTAPVGIFFASSDVFSHEKDVEKLKKTLPNVVTFKKVSTENSSSNSYFSHLDFIFNKDVKKLVYDDVIDLIKDYTDY